MKVDYFNADDLPVFTGWFTHADQVLQFGGPELTFPLTDAFLNSLVKGRGDADVLTFAGRQDGKLVGIAQLHFHSEQKMAVLARVVIDPAQRGRGFSLALLQPLVQTFFADPQMQKLELAVYSFNTAAIRTYSRLGFVYEGIRRGHVVSASGKPWDTLVYSMLREDYQLHKMRNDCAA